MEDLRFVSTGGVFISSTWATGIRGRLSMPVVRPLTETPSGGGDLFSCLHYGHHGSPVFLARVSYLRSALAQLRADPAIPTEGASEY